MFRGFSPRCNPQQRPQIVEDPAALSDAALSDNTYTKVSDVREGIPSFSTHKKVIIIQLHNCLTTKYFFRKLDIVYTIMTTL